MIYVTCFNNANTLYWDFDLSDKSVAGGELMTDATNRPQGSKEITGLTWERTQFTPDF
jgi:hypothetical protein